MIFVNSWVALKVPESQNMDIQLCLSTVCQSQSGFEVAVLETFCLLCYVCPRFSNQVTMLFVRYINLSTANSSVRFMTSDTRNVVCLSDLPGG